MNLYQNKIGIMIPVRNRGKILPFVLDSILNLDYDKKNIGIRFLVNDSTDDTEKIVDDFISKNVDSYFKCDKFVLNVGMREDDRRNRRPVILDHMAFLKNTLFNSMYKEGYDFIFFMDSDLIIPSGLFKGMISLNSDIVSPMINIIPYSIVYRPNGEEVIQPRKCFNFFKFNENNRLIRQTDDSKIIVSDYVCGCFLIRKNLFDFVKFGFEEELGDDDTFMRILKEKRIKIFSIPCPEIQHVFYVDRWLKENG